MAKSAPPKTSSNPTSRFRLCSSFGRVGISGNARDGLERHKLMSTLEEERSIGIASMPQEPRLLHILLGEEFITSCSNFSCSSSEVLPRRSSLKLPPESFWIWVTRWDVTRQFDKFILVHTRILLSANDIGMHRHMLQYIQRHI